MRSWALLGVGLTALMAGCAVEPAGRSVVAPATDAESKAIAGKVVEYLRSEWSPARTVVVVEHADGLDQGIVQQVEAGLRGRGFAVGEDAAAEPGAQHVRLEVTVVASSFLVRIVYGRNVAGLAFARDASGELRAVGPIARREVVNR